MTEDHTGTGLFIVLPKQGFLGAPSTRHAEAMRALPHVHQQAEKASAHLNLGGEPHPVLVLDSVSPTGPKLIEMNQDVGDAHAGKDTSDVYRLFRVRRYKTLAKRPREIKDVVNAGAATQSITKLTLTVTDSSTGAPIAGARVLAFTDYAAQKGSPPATTDASGQAQLYWLKSLPTIEVLEIWPPLLPTYWGVYAQNVDAQERMAFTMEAVNPASLDCVRVLFPNPVFNSQVGVTVGVLDTGVSSHSGLKLIGGRNTVTGEDPEDFGSNGDPHGTHVAGLVGAFGATQGTAPGVNLRSYRVFGEGEANATSFAIVKGIYAGVSDGCDILNLSLGVDAPDTVLREAISHARTAGALVLAAGNNDYGGLVGYPAAYPDCIAVSAMGRLRTFPEGTQPESDITNQRGLDPLNFLAAFTSVGPEIDFIGPGVGAISTIPDNTYGQLSGTSMACPVVAGCAASLLAARADLYAASRNRQRSDAIEQILRDSAFSLGFSADREGAGLPSIPGSAR